MPIFSYLAIPADGAKDALATALTSLPHCEVHAADNADVLVLVTDPPDHHAHHSLLKQLNAIPSLQALSMTFGCSDELQPER